MLACVTGLALLACWLALWLVHAAIPQQLPHNGVLLLLAGHVEWSASVLVSKIDPNPLIPQQEPHNFPVTMETGHVEGCISPAFFLIHIDSRYFQEVLHNLDFPIFAGHVECS